MGATAAQRGREVGAVIDGIRRRLTGWLAERGVPQPEETAAVLVAAIDGVMLHRPLVPGLTRVAVAPVLGRLLTATRAGHEPCRGLGRGA